MARQRHSWRGALLTVCSAAALGCAGGHFEPSGAGTVEFDTAKLTCIERHGSPPMITYGGTQYSAAVQQQQQVRW